METPRRRFLRLVAAVGGIGALNALGVGCGPYEGTSPTAPNNPGGTFEVDLTAYPALTDDGTVVVVSGTPAGSIFVTHTTGDTYYALSRVCTHQGCTVQPILPTLDCPCHGSKYALTGSVVQGPALQALRSWPVTKDGDTLTIDFG